MTTKILLCVVAFLLVVSLVYIFVCTVPKSRYASLQSNYVTLQGEKAVVESELAAVEGVYPPRYFDSYDELRAWVYNHCPVTHGSYNLLHKNLELQEQALADGYIWSVYSDVDLTGIISSVVAGDSIYYVWLDGYIEWAMFRP